MPGIPKKIYRKHMSRARGTGRLTHSYFSTPVCALVPSTPTCVLRLQPVPPFCTFDLCLCSIFRFNEMAKIDRRETSRLAIEKAEKDSIVSLLNSVINNEDKGKRYTHVRDIVVLTAKSRYLENGDGFSVLNL